MRDLQQYIKRYERLRMERKAKRLAMKKNSNYGSIRMRTGNSAPDTGNSAPDIGWMAVLIAHLIRREKGQAHVDKDKERRHQAR